MHVKKTISATLKFMKVCNLQESYFSNAKKSHNRTNYCLTIHSEINPDKSIVTQTSKTPFAFFGVIS